MSATDTAFKPQSPLAPVSSIPRLENGDRLTRAEFERRYEAMPDVKAELIEGVVHMASPVRQETHSAPNANLVTWLGAYAANTPGTQPGTNGTIRLDFDNEPQPDAYLLLPPSLGGQARIDADDYISGAPELCAEVAASSVSIDMNAKLNVYRRNGVKEYVVWRVLDRAIDWFVLREGAYERLAPDEGILKSGVFPGLWLDAEALLRGDMKRVLDVLQSGLQDAAHQVFAERLRSAR